eukprot:COSAG01_NODE_325_length_18790_cov_64.371101_8_plen_65_part_00
MAGSLDERVAVAVEAELHRRRSEGGGGGGGFTGSASAGGTPPHIEGPCSRSPSAGQWFASTAPQ